MLSQRRFSQGKGDSLEEDVWRRRSANIWLRTIEHDIAQAAPLSVSGLRTPEQFVLCNIRLWWHAAAMGTPCARALVRNGFVAANLSRTTHESFEQFMMLLDAAARPRPAIHAVSCPNMSEDEACLLSLVSLCQDGHNGHAIMLLKRWLPPTAYRVSLTNIVNFAGAAAAEGLVLPARVKVPPAMSQAGCGGPRYLLH